MVENDNWEMKEALSALRERVSSSAHSVVLTPLPLKFQGYFRWSNYNKSKPVRESLKCLGEEVISGMDFKEKLKLLCANVYLWGGGVADKGTGIGVYISCSCFLNWHPYGVSGSLGQSALCCLLCNFLNCVCVAPAVWNHLSCRDCPIGVVVVGVCGSVC